MCGIVGCLGNINNPEKKMFRDMLVFDQVRGFDSTGVVVVPYATNRDPFIVKDLGPAQNLWDYDTDKVFDHRGVVNVGVNVLIGHNRAATLGGVTVENAHPFNFDHVYGVHNGSLRYWDDLEGAKSFDVDSKAIYNDIAVNGIDNTWKNFYGAAALVWYDEKQNKVFMIRNSERPLHVARNKAGNALFWASEPWMITVAAARNKVDLAMKDGKADVLQIDTDILYTLSPHISGFNVGEERKLEKKEVPKSTTGGQNGSTIMGFKNPNIKTNKKSHDGRPFHPTKKWKSGTTRLRNALGEITLSNIRHTDRTNIGKNTTESVFRFDIFKKGSLLGRLDVYPTNVKEFNILKEIEGKDLKGLSTFKFSLINNPRLDSRAGYSSNRYVCAFSVLKVQEFSVPEEKQEKTNTNISELPLYKGRNHEDITLSEAEKIIQECGGACCYCSEILEPKDLTTGMFIEKNSCLCPTCNKNWGSDIPNFLRSV